VAYQGAVTMETSGNERKEYIYWEYVSLLSVSAHPFPPHTHCTFYSELNLNSIFAILFDTFVPYIL
jgi:hypothetical protein